jgi:2-iminobutanoate/2-iminopropanoate deaminase
MRKTGKRRIESPDAPGALGPYSPAIRSEAGTRLFVSGQIGVDPGSGEFVPGGVSAQAERCLRSLLALVESAGGSQASVVKVNIYLKSIDDFAAVNEVYSRYFKEPYPARACIGGCQLPRGALVEIEAIGAL